MQNYKKELKDMITKENIKCFDCNIPNPQWTSLSYGIFICLECAGVHRSYGAQISRVKSINMDEWSERDFLFIKHGSNKKLNDFIQRNNLNKKETEFFKNNKMIEYSKLLSDTVNQNCSEEVKQFTIPTYKYNTNKRNTTDTNNYIDNKIYNTNNGSDSSLNQVISSTISSLGKSMLKGAKIIKKQTVKYGGVINQKVVQPSIKMIKEKKKSLFAEKQNNSSPVIIERPIIDKNKKIEDGWNKWD
ncbi:Arf GTPase activating [Tubulinosema ratisbonensis]|uniref:Arf GTPase activating n=1 Tax=Tubulinosema ratisbonensis TaxID=291195 RepID=A0A437AKT4_9MICR|nr:Arf GTPase activating [Tubulinosema ratisbonensis]